MNRSITSKDEKLLSSFMAAVEESLDREAMGANIDDLTDLRISLYGKMSGPARSLANQYQDRIRRINVPLGGEPSEE